MGRSVRGAVAVGLGCLVLGACSAGPAPAQGLSRQARAHLVQQGVLGADEQVLYYSSTAGFERAGVFFTDDQVVKYWMLDDDGGHVRRARWSQIESVRLDEADDEVQVSVKPRDQQYFDLRFYDVDHGRGFYDALCARWAAVDGTARCS